jgi:hypothetical protein
MGKQTPSPVQEWGLRTIVGIMGRKRAGKDTAAGGLIAAGYQHVNFADSLWLVLAAIDPLVNLGPYTDPLRLSALVDAHGWDAAKEIEEVRRLLQRLGTEGGRAILGPNVWVNAWLTRVGNLGPGHSIVTTDVRFPNEAEAIRQLGGFIIRIMNSSLPDEDLHTSETAMDHIVADEAIWNDPEANTADDLRAALGAMVGRLQARRGDLPAGLPRGYPSLITQKLPPANVGWAR